MHGAKTYPRSQGWIPSPLLKPAHLQNLTLAKRNPNDKSQNDKTHLRRKEWWNKEKEAELFFPVTVPVLLRLLRLRTCVKEKKKKYQHTLADAEHTPLSKPDGTEKQESDWKVCLWPQTHWPCDMKGRVNGCHRVCDWSGRSRERLGVQAGGSRLGANQGEKYNQTFWGNMGCLYMSGAADTSYHWSWLHRGNWGQSQPSCTVKTLAPGSPAERVDTKDYVRDSKEDFHFCRDRKHWTVFVNTENAQRAAPARHKLSRITAASPHQRGETGKANCSAGGGNNIVFPKGWTFICTCRAAANCSKNRVSCSTAVNSQTDWL